MRAFARLAVTCQQRPLSPGHQKSAQHRQAVQMSSNERSVASKLAAAALAAVIAGGAAGPALAGKIAEFETSGFLFKDSVQIVEIEDKAVEGVTIYLTDYKRSLTERLGRDPLSDPSHASVTCVPTGTVVVKDPELARKTEGEEIFSEAKNFSLLNQKALRVRRIVDGKNGVVIYVAYSTRFNSANDESERGFSSRYRTSVCAVPVARAASALAE